MVSQQRDARIERQLSFLKLIVLVPKCTVLLDSRPSRTMRIDRGKNWQLFLSGSHVTARLLFLRYHGPGCEVRIEGLLEPANICFFHIFPF